MNWIFDKNPSFNPSQKFPEISILGGYELADNIPCKMLTPMARIFADQFDKYILEKKEKLEQKRNQQENTPKKNEKEKEKDNKNENENENNKVEMNENGYDCNANVRPICRWWALSFFKFLSKLHCNFTSLRLLMPDSQFHDSIKMESLDDFFQIFHSNVIRFELSFYQATFDILSQFFKIENNNSNSTSNSNSHQKQKQKPFAKDLKSQANELSFESFLAKNGYICNNSNNNSKNNKFTNDEADASSSNYSYSYNLNSLKQCRLPQIETLGLVFVGTIPQVGNTVIELLNQEKLIKLLNVEETVNEIITLMAPDTCQQSIRTAFSKIFQRFVNLTSIDFRFKIVHGQATFEHISRIYKESLIVWLLEAACARNIKQVIIQIGRPRYECLRNDEFEIEIEHRDLLNVRKNELKERIEKILDGILESIEEIWENESENIVTFRQYLTQKFTFVKRFQL